MDHFAWRCPLPAGQVRCARCGGNHPMDIHDYKCPGNHQGKAKCDCIFPCLLCGQKGHHARSWSCPKCADIVKLYDSSPLPKRAKATPAPARDRTPNAEAHRAHAMAVRAPPCKVDPSLNVFQCGLLNKEEHKECQIPIKDARLPFNSHQLLTKGVAVGIVRSKRMALENNLEFDINDPLGLRTSAQTYEDMTQEEFERQRLDDDRQAAVARNIAEDDDLSPEIRVEARAVTIGLHSYTDTLDCIVSFLNPSHRSPCTIQSCV